jgi:hypothetical protein
MVALAVFCVFFVPLADLIEHVFILNQRKVHGL